jgi:hypothetical protein
LESLEGLEGLEGGQTTWVLDAATRTSTSSSSAQCRERLETGDWSPVLIHRALVERARRVWAIE